MDFLEYVDQELEKRGWTRNKLAKLADISASTFTLISKGQRGVGPDVCRKIARAFKVPESEVLRWANIIDTVADDPALDQLNHKLRLLPEGERHFVTEFVDYLLARNDLNDKPDTPR